MELPSPSFFNGFNGQSAPHKAKNKAKACFWAQKNSRNTGVSGVLVVKPYQNRFPAFRKKNHLILRRITIGAYAMLPFRRATAYNSLIA